MGTSRTVPAKIGQALRSGLYLAALLCAAFVLSGGEVFAQSATVASIMTAADPAGAVQDIATALGAFLAGVVLVYAGFKTVKMALRFFGWARG